MLQHEEEVSMATLRAAPTGHCHTEQFSGILTNQHLPGPDLKREGGMEGGRDEKKENTAQNGKQATSYSDNTL